MIFKFLMYVLSHGCLLSSYKSFFNFHTCVLSSGGCKISLRSLCLLSMTSLVLWIFPYIPWCFHFLDFVDPYGRYYRLPFRYSTSHSSHHSSFWIIIVNLELSSLFLWNKSHPSFLASDCTRSFLQVKCTSCMVRNIS